MLGPLRVLEFSTFGSMGYTVLLDVILDDETAITVTEKMRLKGEIDPCYLFLGNDDGCDEGCYFINCSSGPQRGFVGWIEYDDVNLLLEFVVDPACCIDSWDNKWAFMHDIVEREISARKEFGCFPGYPQSGW